MVHSRNPSTCTYIYACSPQKDTLFSAKTLPCFHPSPPSWRQCDGLQRQEGKTLCVAHHLIAPFSPGFLRLKACISESILCAQRLGVLYLPRVKGRIGRPDSFFVLSYPIPSPSPRPSHAMFVCLCLLSITKHVANRLPGSIRFGVIPEPGIRSVRTLQKGAN